VHYPPLHRLVYSPPAQLIGQLEEKETALLAATQLFAGSPWMPDSFKRCSTVTDADTSAGSNAKKVGVFATHFNVDLTI